MVETLFMLSIKKKRKEWEVEIKKIKKIEKTNVGISIYLKEKIKRIEVRHIFFKFLSFLKGFHFEISMIFEKEKIEYLFKTLLKVLEINKSI